MALKLSLAAPVPLLWLQGLNTNSLYSICARRSNNISPAARSHELQQLPSGESPCTAPTCTAPRHPSTSGSSSHLCGDPADISLTLLNNEQSAHLLLQVFGQTASGPPHTSHKGGTHSPQSCERVRHNIPGPIPAYAVTTDVPRAHSSLVLNIRPSSPPTLVLHSPTLLGGEFLPFPKTLANCQKLCLLHAYLLAE